MRQWIGIIFFCLACAYSAFALRVEIPVTPASLNSDSSHLFSVSTNAVQNGLAFHISYSPKSADAGPNVTYSAPSMGLGIAKNEGSYLLFDPVKPAIPVAIKKQKDKWTADFVVPHGLLKNADLYFTVSESPVGMPDVTVFEIRLRDFGR